MEEKQKRRPGRPKKDPSEPKAERVKLDPVLAEEWKKWGSSTITDNVTRRVLQSWVNFFLEDVRAIHTPGGQYLIKYDTLIAHINNLSKEAVQEITEKANE